MPRYKLTIEYDGTPYVGWQMQENGPSVQARLATAINAFSGEKIVPAGAGRTDAGVHALGQVAHIELQKEWPNHKIIGGLNHHLKPEPICILDCRQVEDDFDARFSARQRHYLYRIIVRRAPLVLERKRAWQIFDKLDIKAMNKAAGLLIGKHDFTTFRSVNCQSKSPIKTMDHIAIAPHIGSTGGAELIFKFAARSFMHNQVRSIVGSLKFVGEGRWPIERMAAALEARDRAACAPVAPSWGLYLSHIDYDEPDQPA